ncbi:MAG: hypothetical protein EP297_06055 [Gammaproteobacteria bacterium]|nr:MAG: hypothetical protein EP297_06055 [Gammaproteobacteria bacterium]
MRRLRFLGVVSLMMANVHVNATEITACIINTKSKNNEVYYVFPTTSTKLICDHSNRQYDVTLTDLYKDGWRLVNLLGPVLVGQSSGQPKYNPPILYLERATATTPALSLDPVMDTHLTGKAIVETEKEDNKAIETTKTSTAQKKEEIKEPEREKRGGFFDWLAPKLDIDKSLEEEGGGNE